MAKSLVAVVGKPNVGKSTLFNRLSGKRTAIVEDTPGVTRDRIYEDVEWRSRSFTLIDTGGIDVNTDDILLSQMRRQAEIAVETCDLVLFVTDVRGGVTSDDRDVADLLRRSGRPILLVANKADTKQLEQDAIEFLELGLGDPICVSAANMMGLGDLLDAIYDALPNAAAVDEEDTSVKVAVVGKPNAGKSSLVNRLLGEERVMVSDIPGTTRDAIDTKLTVNGRAFTLIDTAGIRRKRAVEDGTLERYSVIRAIASIKRCDVAVLVVDASEGLSEQDAKIAGLTHDEGKALVILVNKWDTIEKETGTLEKFEKQLRSELKFTQYAQILFVSALTGQRTGKILEAALEAYEQSVRRVTTGTLNDVLAEAQISMQPPSFGGKRLKLYYATQPTVAPPTFLFFVNDEKIVHFAYSRYLENRIRTAFGFQGTPIRLIFRNRKDN